MPEDNALGTSTNETAMSVAHILGFPRIGARRELKMAVEAYWKRAIDKAALIETGRADLRKRHWALQKAAGLDLVTVGDFAFYDHLHNVTALVSAAPKRFAFEAPVDLDGYFAMACGTGAQPALAMKKMVRYEPSLSGSGDWR